MSNIERIDRRPGRSAALAAAAVFSQRSARFPESKTVELGSNRSEARQPTPAPAELPGYPAERTFGAGTPPPAGRSQRLRWLVDRPITGRYRPADGDGSDEALLGLVARGDKPAMRALFGRFNVRVFRFLVRLVKNDALAEELLNDVFIAVWRHAGQFRARSRVSTWLLAIARQKALSVLGRRTEEELDEVALRSIKDPADDPEAALRKVERNKLMRDCLEQLSPAHREVVDLVYYHERTTEEVADILAIPRATVKTRMFYARKRLGELLAVHGIERVSV
jgi:RNA polymerase sigma-70 factor (ECF subfamily)